MKHAARFLLAVAAWALTSHAVAQSVLANLAASMQPGTWAEINTVNIDTVLANTGGASGTTLSFSDNAVWDPVSKKIFFIGGDHDPADGCPRFVSYTESTNTWQRLPNASWFWCGSVSRMHGLNHNAIDTVAAKLYHRPFSDMVVRKYDIATATWSNLPTLTLDIMGYNQCCVAIAWFPERNALEYASIENGNLGALVEYSETTHQWRRVAADLPMGQYQNFGKYDPVNKIFLFGGGEGDRHVYKLDQNGVVTALGQAPTGIGVLDTVTTSDPVTGDYLFLDNSNHFYQLDVNANKWTLLPSTPILTPPRYDPPTNGIVVTPIPEYGVNFYARCYVNDCRAYLYKHVEPVPDTTPPTLTAVTATNVTASHATITWTTSEASNTRVEYGETQAYGQSTPLAPAQVTSHSVEIFGLAPTTVYHYLASSTDASGNTGSSADLTFITTAPDAQGPTISGVGTTNVTSTAATVIWTTDELADSQVEYGTTTSYGQTTSVDAALVTAHSVALTGLASNVTQHFRVRSKDADGNTTTSPDFTFATSGGPLAAYAFDEGAGLTTVDTTGNGHTGTLSGPTWIAGKNGNALSFDGSNDKVALPATLDVTRPFTVEAWIRPTSYAQWRSIFSKRSGFALGQMRFDLGLQQTTGFVYLTNGNTVLSSAYKPTLNTWTHIAAVSDTTSTRLYVNGALQQTLAAFTTGTSTTAPVALGATGDNDDWYAGALDDVRLYNRALTLSEVQIDMASPAGGAVLHITQPSTGAALSGPTVNVGYNVTGDVAQAALVRFTLDGGTSVDDTTVDGSYQLKSVADGAHTLAGHLVRTDGTKIFGSDASVSFSTAPPDVTAPTAPSDLGAAVVSATQINLSWTASTDDVGVTSYTIEGCLTATCTFALVSTTSSTSFSVTGLAAATGYSYRVLARDAAGNLSGYSNSASATTSALPPTTPTLAAVATGTQIDLTWTASTSAAGIAGYELERCIGAACTTFLQIAAPTTTSYSDAGLADATTYSYRVLARDTNGTPSAYSNRATATTVDVVAPTAPASLTATAASSTQINLSWPAASDNLAVTGYRVERCAGVGCANFAQIATPTGLTLNNTGLTASTSYSYRVRATDAAGNLGGYSPSATAATPAAPDTTAPSTPTGLGGVAISTSQIDLTWTASTDNVGVTGYQLDRCTGASCTTFAQIATPTSAGYSDLGLTASTAYRYRVRAVDAAGNASANSSIVTVATQGVPDTTAPTAPSALAATAASATAINLSWTASTDAVGVTGYLVERCLTASCTYAQIATPTATSYADSGLTASTGYSYRVRATDLAANLSAYSNVATATTQAPATGPALALGFNEGTGTTAADASGNGLNGTLLNGPTWVAGHTSNAVSFDGTNDQISVPSSFDVTALPFTVEAWIRPTSFSSYRAIFSKRSSATAAGMRFDIGLWAASGRVFVYTARSTLQFTSAPPLNTWTHIAVVASATATQLYVNGVLRETGAAVLLGTGSTAAVSVGRTGDNDDPFAGQIDDLRVHKRALSLAEIQTDMNTPVGPVGPDTTAPSTPAGLGATASSPTRVDLTWTASTDNVSVTGYVVERCETASCAYAQIATPTATSYGDTSAAASTDYNYRVRATDAAGNTSSYSNVASITTPTPDTTAPTAPATLGATVASSTQVNLSWAGATDDVGVTGYLLERCLTESCSFAQIASLAGTVTSINNTGLTASTSYSYRVRATDAAGNLGGYSPSATAATPAAPDTTAPSTPTGLGGVAISTSQIDLTWTASTDNVGVTGYQLDRCTGASCTTFAQIATPTSAGYSDLGLTASTAYRYRVRAVDAAGNASANSSIVTVATQGVPDTTAPTAPSALAATAASATAINLSWTASTDAVGVTGYLVERCLTASCTYAQIATPTATSYADSGLTASTGYSYRVRATDLAANLSAYSNVATATTQAPATGPALALGFNEGTGTTAADASGNGLNGTLLNGPTWVAGHTSNAVSFDGTNDQISVPSSFDVTALPFTVEAWIRPTSFSSYRAIFSKRSSATAAGMRFDIGLWAASGRVFVYTARSTLQFTSAPPLNTWTHIAVVASATATQLYVNGVLRETGAAVLLGTGSTAAVSVGRTGDNDDPFAGQIDDLRVHKRALSLAEIQTDMNTPVTP